MPDREREQANPVAQITAGLQLWRFVSDVAAQALASKAPFVILGAAAPLIAAWFLLKK